MPKACAIIGDKPTRFKFGYKEDYSLCKKIKRVMLEQIKKLYDEEDVKVFYIGGSLGVDIWAGEMILRLKEQSEYANIELVVVTPYEGHDAKWDKRSRERLKFLIKHSKIHLVIRDGNGQDRYINRNRYLVENVGWILAICDNNIKNISDTEKMISYAKKMRRHIIFILPDTANIVLNYCYSIK